MLALEIRSSELPIGQLLEDCLDKLRASVAIIDVVRVFPHVDSKKRLLAVLHWQIGIGCAGDLERSLILHQPCPAGTELACGRRGKLSLELIERAKVARDRVSQCSRGTAAGIGGHALPKETVVPMLGRIVEQTAVGTHDDLFQRLILVRCAFDGLVEIGDIGSVVFAVVVVKRLGAHVWLQRGLVVRKLG